MSLPASSVFKAGNAVLFDLDDTLVDRDLARDRFFSFLLKTYFPDLNRKEFPGPSAWTHCAASIGLAGAAKPRSTTIFSVSARSCRLRPLSS